MVLRLSILTGLMALFALGFSALVQSELQSGGRVWASAGCYDQGAVCARPAAN